MSKPHPVYGGLRFINIWCRLYCILTCQFYQVPSSLLLRNNNQMMLAITRTWYFSSVFPPMMTYVQNVPHLFSHYHLYFQYSGCHPTQLALHPPFPHLPIHSLTGKHVATVEVVLVSQCPGGSVKWSGVSGPNCRWAYASANLLAQRSKRGRHIRRVQVSGWPTLARLCIFTIFLPLPKFKVKSQITTIIYNLSNVVSPGYS